MVTDYNNRFLTDTNIENFQTNTVIYYGGCIYCRGKILWTRGDYDFRKLIIDETGVDRDNYDSRF